MSGIAHPTRSAWAGLWPRWPGWDHVPRDTRDTLFQLAVIGWTALPHVSHLPWWCSCLCALMLLWRGHLALTQRPLPKRWAVAGITGLAVLLTIWSEGTFFGKEAGVIMLVVMMSLKTLELRARRDALVVFFLGFFLVLTNFLYSQSLFTAVAMLASVAGLLTALVLAHMPVGRPPIRQAAVIAGRAALLGAPIMVALFVFFPRIGPLWGLPQDAAGKTGLSGTLQLGNVADLANDDAIALRVRFHDRVPLPSSMYFRGPVLAGFDGKEWTRDGTRLRNERRLGAEVQVQGTGISYEVTLEPSRLTVLPMLEATPPRPDTSPQVDGYAATLQHDMQWVVDRPITERLRFDAVAWPSFRQGEHVSLGQLRENLLLPNGFNPGTVAWAQALQNEAGASGGDEAALVKMVLSHIRKGGYTYTLEPGEYGRDAIDEFWLDRKRGFCEHFAASFVVIMRAMGVPARIVTGYQGTDPDPVDGYFIVRQRNAHAWAEYWARGTGWVRVDPTAAVSPERVVRGRSLKPASNFVQKALADVNPELVGRIRSFFEATNNRWNQWVMNYSRSQQFKLLEDLGVKAPDWADLGYILVGLIGMAALAATAWALWDRRRQDPWQRLQQRVQARLASLKIHVHMHDAPRTRAQRVREAKGEAAQELAETLDELDRMRYAAAARAKPDPRWWRRFEAAAARCGGAGPAI